MSVAFLINARSSGGGKKGRRLADALAGNDNYEVEVLQAFADLQPILKRFGEQGVTSLFISSGDGTVQAIQTILAEQQLFEQLPALALLPHGTTNMNASTLGLKLKDPQKILTFASNLGNAKRKTRHSLRIANPADKNVRHGMFVGTGAIRGAVEFTQSTMNSNNIRGELAPLATLFSLLSRYMFSGGDNKVTKPYPLHVTVDGKAMTDGDQLVFLASTLERLVLKSHPYWGSANSELRALSVAYPPPNVLTSLLPLLYGVPSRNLPISCQSRSAQSIEISGSIPWVVDGEFFDAPSDEPLRLELGTEFTYLCAS